MENNNGNFLSINEAVQRYSASCDGKIKTPFDKLFIKAMLAGMMIAMGAAGSSVACHAIGNVGLARLVAGVVFPVGLMMVILTGAELFTGDCLMIVATVEKKNTMAQMIKELVFIYIGNFVGAALLALGVYFSGQLGYSSNLLGAYTIKVAVGKTGLSFGTALVSGILCNILVCVAVLMAICSKDIVGKLFVSFFVIMLFVVCGFEHCVANMYYITAGLLCKLNPAYVQLAMEQYGYTADQLAALNVGSFLVGNLLPVTIGNMIGGMVTLGLPLWYVNKEGK